MQRLSGADANFLYQETPTALMHTLKIELVRMSAERITLESLKAAMQPMLAMVPQLRRRVVFVPFNLHHPVLVDDPNFDVEFHICRAALPAPGGRAEFEEMLAQIASHPLDRDRPLWELWVLTGLEDPTVAVAVQKIHHAMADGMAAMRFLTRVFASAHPSPPTAEWRADPLPSGRRLVWDALVDHVRYDMRNLPAIARGVWRAVRGLSNLQKVAEAPQMEAIRNPLPRTRFNFALTTRRCIAMRQLPLAAVRNAKSALGGSVNDVVLALCASALRRYLEQRGELPPGPLGASVPTTIEEGGSVRDFGNRVSSIATWLWTNIADPRERYAAIRRSTAAGKQELDVMGKQTYANVMQYVPPFLTIRSRQRQFRTRAADAPGFRILMNLVISNVPGPAERLRGDYGELLDLYSMGVLLEGCGLNITVWSYAGNLNFVLASCKKAMPDLGELADALQPALDELCELAATDCVN